MPIALVANTKLSGGGGTSPGIDTTGATLLVASVMWYSNNGWTSISDSKGNTWTALTQRTLNSGSQQLFYVANPVVGSGHTLTIGSGPIYCAAFFTAWSGVTTTSPFDAQNGGTTAGTSVATGSVSPAQDNELLFTGAGGGQTPHSIDLSFTLLDEKTGAAGVNYAGAVAYQIQTTATARNPTWTCGSGDLCAAIATFKASAAPSSAGMVYRRRSSTRTLRCM